MEREGYSLFSPPVISALISKFLSNSILRLSGIGSFAMFTFSESEAAFCSPVGKQPESTTSNVQSNNNRIFFKTYAPFNINNIKHRPMQVVGLC